VLVLRLDREVDRELQFLLHVGPVERGASVDFGEEQRRERVRIHARAVERDEAGLRVDRTEDEVGALFDHLAELAAPEGDLRRGKAMRASDVTPMSGFA
jgi:hypothetical protein